MLALRRAFSPFRYRFGRPVAALCAGYLVLLHVAAWVAMADAVRPDPETIGASFAAVPLVVLSAPTSILTTPVVEQVRTFLTTSLPVSGTAQAVASCVLLLAMGVGQAGVVFVLLRGPREDANLTVR